MSGWEIVHATLAAPMPWRQGFARIEGHLTQAGRPRQALCGIMLRSPAPFSFDGFDGFNQGYRELLEEWKILLDGDNPIPRTNVAPVMGAPAEPMLYAFDYTVAGATPAPTFVIAGAGELRERGRGAEGIVRRGETSPDAMREKARFVLTIMQDRLRALGGAWERVTTIDVYTAYPIHGIVEDEILRAAGPAAIHGVRWYPSRPPIRELEFELDMRGVAREIVL
jgi:hypothetical protein